MANCAHEPESSNNQTRDSLGGSARRHALRHLHAYFRQRRFLSKHDREGLGLPNAHRRAGYALVLGQLAIRPRVAFGYPAAASLERQQGGRVMWVDLYSEFLSAWRRLEDSLLGDVIGGFCLLILLCAAPILLPLISMVIQ